jgi:hypothetical protein
MVSQDISIKECENRFFANLATNCFELSKLQIACFEKKIGTKIQI